jgi:site-specific recombinase XerD
MLIDFTGYRRRSVQVAADSDDRAPHSDVIAPTLRVTVIPIGIRALDWVAKWRDDVRPAFASGSDAIGGDGGTLFLTTLCEAFAPNRLTQMVRNTIDAAGTGKRGSCHLFRHTMGSR